MTGALSGHYAAALADAVFQPQYGLKPEDAVAQLKRAAELLSGSHQLQVALLSPAVNRQRKTAIVGTLAGKLELHRLIRNFLSVLVLHRRTREIGAIAQSFEDEVDGRLGWVRAQIVSARELNPAQREEIERALGTKLGKFIRAGYRTDPSLLAGVRAHVGPKQYDATLRSKLEGLRQSLHASL